MPWNGSAPSKTFGRTDGTRTGTQVWQQADAAAVDIVAPDHDTHDQDLASGLNLALLKNGDNTATSNIPMGGFTFTNLAAATARTTPARFSDVQDGKGVYIATVGGTANVVTLTNSIVITAYAAGQTFKFIAAATNTDAVTVNVDGVGAKNVYNAGIPLTAGQIVSSQMVEITYDGTQFQLKSESPAAISVGFIAAWPTATVPAGWLECDGSAVSRTTYAALFAVISTTYGVGDGSTTFTLPNYKDYFLRGFDASGTDAAARTDRGDGTTGASIGTKQAAGTNPHTHAFTTASDGAHTHTVNRDLDASLAQGTGGSSANFTGTGTEPTSSDGAHTHTGTTDLSAGTNTETRPKNITVKWCILALPAAAISTQTIAPYFSVLDADRAGSNADTAQAVFGSAADAITLPPATSYFFEALYHITRSAGGDSHDTSVLFGGTATFTSILYSIESTTTTGAPIATTASQQLVAAVATATVAATTSTSTTENIVIKLNGIMRINATGTVIPQFKYSAAPGGAPTIKANSFFKLTPVGANTVTSSGPWG